MPDYVDQGSGETGKKEIGASGDFGETEWNNLVSNTDLGVDSQGRLRLAQKAAPTSAKYNWNPQDFSTGNSSWEDTEQSEVMDMYGDPQKTTFSDGSDAIEFDGGDDFGQAIQSFGTELSQSAIEFEIESSDFGGGWWGTGDSNSLPFFHIRFDLDAGFNSDNGNFALFMRDSNDDDIRCAPTNNPNLDDGNKHRVSVLLNDTTNNDIEIIIDGTSVSLTFAESFGPDFSNNFFADFGFAGRSTGSGTADNNLSAKHGIIRFHDQAISGQTI